VVRRLVLIAAAALLLTGCAPLPFDVGSPPPSPVQPHATVVPLPEHTATALPTTGAGGCTLTLPGSYQVGDCPVLQVNGNQITVTAGRAGSIQVNGDRAQVIATAAGAVQIKGQDDIVIAGGDIGSISIAGDRDEIDAQGRIASGSIAGNDNILKAPGGVGAITDDGARNTIPGR
jgi:hypothetical protein